MITIRTFIKRRPLLMYFALTFVISWGGLLMAIGLDGILGAREIAEALMPFVYLATLLGPSAAGIIMTGLVHGREGFRELGSQLFNWRVGARWYAVALLTAPLLMTATLLALSLASPVFLPAIFTFDNKVSLLLTGSVAGLMVAIFEEIGWTAFAAPQLRLRYSVLTGGLIVGLLWGLWHLPLFTAGANSSGLPTVLYLGVLLFSWLPPYRVLMVWVYDSTKSLLVVILMHVPIVVGQFVLISPAMSGVPILAFDLMLAAALWIVVVVASVANGRQFSRQSLQRRVA
ncbi:MAG: CPBP family intramembrane glutamic endopeptidase [Chloroflexota bacterium]